MDPVELMRIASDSSNIGEVVKEPELLAAPNSARVGARTAEIFFGLTEEEMEDDCIGH